MLKAEDRLRVTGFSFWHQKTVLKVSSKSAIQRPKVCHQVRKNIQMLHGSKTTKYHCITYSRTRWNTQCPTITILHTNNNYSSLRAKQGTARSHHRTRTMQIITTYQPTTDLQLRKWSLELTRYIIQATVEIMKLNLGKPMPSSIYHLSIPHHQRKSHRASRAYSIFSQV